MLLVYNDLMGYFGLPQQAFSRNIHIIWKDKFGSQFYDKKHVLILN